MTMQLSRLKRYPSVNQPHAVPPSPKLMAQLYAKYLELLKERRLPQDMTFEQFFNFWSASRRGENFVGLDDGATEQKPSSEPQLIDRPPHLWSAARHGRIR